MDRNPSPIRILLWSMLGGAFLVAIAFLFKGVGLKTHFTTIFGSRKTVAERVLETQGRFEKELLPLLYKNGIVDRPSHIVLSFVKNTKTLELYAGNSSDSLRFIKAYSVQAASGQMGPKLVSGDHQVPEGVYAIESLNPNSRFYLSLRVNYPNLRDQQMGLLDLRSNLGSDIMIHGSSVSVGCIAIGDENIAEIFHLAGQTNLSQWKLLLAPVDLRRHPPPDEVITRLPWMREVYADLELEMKKLPGQP